MEASRGTAVDRVAPLTQICRGFVQERVTELDLSGCSEDLISEIIHGLVSEREVTGPTLKKLLSSSSGGLSRLNLRDSGNMEDQAFKEVGLLCPKLEALNLERCRQITGHVLQGIARACPSLRTLVLSRLDRAVDDHCVRSIAKSCPHLQSVAFVGCYNLTDVGVGDLVSSCNELQALDFKSCSKLTDRSVLAIAEHCPNLQFLNLKLVSKISDQSVTLLLQRCRSLKNLNVKQCTRLTDKAFQTFACSGLRKLSIGYCNRISTRTLLKVASVARSLEVLDCQGHGITSEVELIEAILRFEDLQQLNTFNLGDSLTNKFLESISGKNSPLRFSLKGLYIGNNTGQQCKINDDGIARLCAGITNLNKLIIGNLSISDSSLKAIAASNQLLNHFAMWSCRDVTSIGLAHLLHACSSSLQKLTITDNSLISEEAFLPPISSSSSTVFHISQLRLLNCRRVNDEFIRRLLDCSSSSLCKLLLSGCDEVRDEGVGEALERCSRLLEMDLSYCRRVTADVIDRITNDEKSRARLALQKLSLEGMLWLQTSHVQAILDACPKLVTLYAADCERVSGERLTIPRFDVTVYLSSGIYFKRLEAH